MNTDKRQNALSSNVLCIKELHAACFAAKINNHYGG